jgi:hypothetical protein
VSAKHRLIRAARWITLAAATMIIAGAAVALGAVQRRATVDVPPQTAGSATAQCRDGQVALAAGFASPGFDPMVGAPVARIASRPSGKHAVKTTGFNFSDTATNELDSFAYCGKRKRPPTVVSSDIQVEPNGGGSVVAECPKGSKAISGGFGSHQGVIALTSKRSGNRGWKVVGVSLGDGAGVATLTAYAICKAPGPTLVTESKESTVGHELLTTDVMCPDGGKAVSGGFDGHVSGAGGMLTAAGALDSKRIAQGRGWTTSATSVSESDQVRLTTYAYCRG